MAITIKHAKTDNISDWTQADLDQQIAAGNYPPGTTLADIVLPSDWNDDHSIVGNIVSSITSTDGSIIVTGTSDIDLAVATAGSTQNVLCRIRNNTGATLTKGTVVYISGATGQLPTVSKAIATSDATSAQTLGMITSDLANNTNGYVTIIGLIDDIDTSAYTDGQQLYLSGTTAGAVTATKPSAPTHLVYVAVVEYANPVHGKLFVKVQNGYELNEIHDVAISSPTTGQTIVYNSGTSLWNNSNAVVMSGGSVDNSPIGATTASTGKFTSVTTPSVTATTTDLTLSAISTGNISLNTPNGTAFKVLSVGAASSNWLQVGNPSTTVIRLGPAGTTVADFRILAPTFTTFYTGSSADGLSDGSQQARIAHTASAVNYVQVTGAATNANPVISAQGSDSTVNLSFQRKGNGNFQFLGPVILGSNAVNYWQTSGAATTLTPQLQTLGSDTNISMAFQPKGTGAIDLAAGSSGVNISNGGTVTGITRLNGSTGYTTNPTVTISAPTTAGGVQATATCTLGLISSSTIGSGGTGYTVGDTLTVSGGTFTTVATITVSTVAAGVITGFTVANFGAYTVAPTNPATLTGGTGSGATLNTNFTVNAAFTITNAGSGYIEQPTVSFSSGAATAYATVGSVPTIKGLGSSLFLATPNGNSFSVADQGVNVVNYIQARGNSAGNAPFLFAQGSDTNVGLTLTTKGTNSVNFTTNSGVTQAVVSHTASAVNYVQVTGNVTTSPPIISAQGSDATVAMLYRTKGNGVNHSFQNGSGNNGFVVTPVNNTANYLQASSSIATAAPSLAAAGSDTNIDLALTPKGTGLVAFGTYTAGAPAATGYISIKSAAGVTYKVLVST